MKASELLGLDESIHEILNFHSNLCRSGISQAIESVSIMQDSRIKYSDLCRSSIENLAGAYGNLNELQNSNVLGSIKIDYMSGVGVIKNAGAISSIIQMNGALGIIRDSGILGLSSSMKSWQSNMEQMSKDFMNSYNSIVEGAVNNIASGIRLLNQNMIDFSAIKLLDVNELIPELANIDELKFDEELEKKIDLQEVEEIVNSRIEEANVIVREQNNGIILAINQLGEKVAESIAKGGIKDTVVGGILLHIAIYCLSFIFGFINPYTLSNADIKHTIKTTKQIVRTMEIDNNFYNVVRIAAKDELAVRRTSSMKSRIKYYLDFGDLVKIEHKNKNWTKISYTNKFTNEREIGWVLTRYIKRLD